jgi:hypothetical protein
VVSLLAAAVVVVVALAGPPRAAAHEDHSTATGRAEGAPSPTERELAALADNETAAIGGASLAADDGSLPGAEAETRRPVADECPVMSDSIRRLYLGFLEREPTVAELERNIDLYRAGEASLDDLASALANSGAFRTRYGPLSDAAYVQRVYANTLDREPSQADARHWEITLGNGYPRGAVMLAFTESAEFVRRTGTSRPLSGYLAWYPRGVHWYCGVGPRNDLPIRELIGEFVYADYLFSNRGSGDVAIAITTILDGRTVVEMVDATVPPGFTDFRWDGVFAGNDHYGEAIDVQADDDTSWVVVFYPERIGDQRLGWHLPR